ncbi:response regulator transcription factor [Streptomyces sp. XD-27]|uniref:response regulator transcription factor n=1 Tax=Streptomyces sp. XD-27 TaxID=3062779 RepID=UPI0026F4494C|nr:response regulator transcription factor [Streptomyces sp. XD-27]WKX69493.1 response regulator transcription factor [Streptomyces sp. XD-27]
MRIVIAEASTVLRAGLAQVLDGGGHRVAAAAPGTAELPALVARHRPDAVVVGVRPAGPFGGDHSVEDVLTARRTRPGTAALLYSAAPEPGLAARLFACGRERTGLVLRDHITESEALFAALGRIAAGGSVVDPRAVAPGDVGAPAPPPDPAGPAARADLAALSARELDVLRLMAQGRTNSAIADELCVSAGTVEKRAAAVFGKLGLPGGDRDNRRVLAVLRFLDAQRSRTPAFVDAPARATPFLVRRAAARPVSRARAAA